MSKIVLSASRDIPLDKLILSQPNVRRIKDGISIEELAEDIARRGLLQSLSVRPVLDGEGHETGTYEVPAGGRRFQAAPTSPTRPARWASRCGASVGTARERRLHSLARHA